MAGTPYGRSEKYHRRERFLYALVFDDVRRFVYIGQSVDPDRRFAQHCAHGWGKRPFHMVVLGSMWGTQAEAEDWEHAYRQAAAWWRWGVYALPPGIVIRRVARQMTPRRTRLAWRLWWGFAGALKHGRRVVRPMPTPPRKRRWWWPF
ncbi:MAG TPA: hypothetical protein VMB73_18235 [Acetobacteraceae bacterium]|nr:hypothetical protein [Acetobacteraceae bacterium]